MIKIIPKKIGIAHKTFIIAIDPIPFLPLMFQPVTGIASFQVEYFRVDEKDNGWFFGINLN